VGVISRGATAPVTLGATSQRNPQTELARKATMRQKCIQKSDWPTIAGNVGSAPYALSTHIGNHVPWTDRWHCANQPTRLVWPDLFSIVLTKQVRCKNENSCEAVCR
jgi:hypothetical protein